MYLRVENCNIGYAASRICSVLFHIWFQRSDFEKLRTRSEEEGRPLASFLVGLGPGLLALAEERGREDLHPSLCSVIEDVRSGDLRPTYYPAKGRVLPFPPSEWEGEESLASLIVVPHR